VVEARATYLTKLFKDKTPEEIAHYAAETEGLGMAHLRELAVSMLAFNHTFEATVARMKGNVKEVFRMSKVGEKLGNVGFTIGFKKGGK
jgi:hypothetical protein